MAFRFRKSFKIAPGMRMSLSGSGASFNFGPRGASISVGKRGAYLNSSIPGTGFSSRQKLSGSSSSSVSRSRLPQMSSMAVSIGIRDDGEIYFQDPSGNALDERQVSMVKKQHADSIRGLIQSKCDEINQQIESVGELHRWTPSPDDRPTYSRVEFSVSPPLPPTLKKPGLLAKLFKSKRAKVEADNQRALDHHGETYARWDAERMAHNQAEVERRILIEQLIYSDTISMENYLEASLQDIQWPKETMISTEISDDGKRVLVDVDLPEIEDMPSKTATAPTRGFKLSVKDMTPTQVQRLYMRHIHAVGFRIVGEVFATLPKCDEVVLSGFSQRRDRATGRLNDEYLYSVAVARNSWRETDFSQDGLNTLDVVEAFGRFRMRRTMSKTGIFKPITPFSSEDSFASSGSHQSNGSTTRIDTWR